MSQPQAIKALTISELKSTASMNVATVLNWLMKSVGDYVPADTKQALLTTVARVYELIEAMPEEPPPKRKPN